MVISPSGPGSRMTAGARGGFAEQVGQAMGHLGSGDVLEVTGDDVGFGGREAESVGQEHPPQPATPQNPGGDPAAGIAVSSTPRYGTYRTRSLASSFLTIWLADAGVTARALATIRSGTGPSVPSSWAIATWMRYISSLSVVAGAAAASPVAGSSGMPELLPVDCSGRP